MEPGKIWNDQASSTAGYAFPTAGRHNSPPPQHSQRRQGPTRKFSRCDWR
jgi:hypothetical protein